MGQLTELQIKAAQTRDAEYLLSDGDGLYLRVRPNAAKGWVYRYKRDGRAVKLTLGPHPALSLAAARKKSHAAAERLADGGDPQQARREERERGRAARLNTFELTARAWIVQSHKDRQWSATYAKKLTRHLELHVFPWIGARTIESILPTELVRCFHRIKDRGHLETALRVREAVVHVYQYAVDIGVLEPARNFVNARTGALPSPRTRHYAAITDPQKFGQLLRDIAAYQGNVITRAALRLAPLLFQRPGQLRLAHWEDIDLEQKLWRCPAEKMKMREWKKRDARTPAHLVPLPTQAIDILLDLQPLTGPTGPIFKSMSKRSEATRYMSDNTINAALRTLGYDTREQITGHGCMRRAVLIVQSGLT